MDFAETIRGIFGGQSSQPPPSGDDYAAPLRPMVDPAARTRAVGGSPEFQGKVDETLRDALRETAEPFKQVGRAISGRSDNPVPEALLGGLGVATAIPGGIAKGALRAGAKLGGEALEDILAPAAKKAATGGVEDMIKAYHGSPHDFDRFDLSKIGTGEGAQAYGHGLYFAENEGVAKGYRDALGPGFQPALNGVPFGKLPEAKRSVAQWMANTGAHPDEIAKISEERGHKALSEAKELGLGDIGDIYAGKHFDQAKAARELSKEGKWDISHIPNGRMYEVGIRANPEHFLDWDKPLNQQHERTQAALQQAMGEKKWNQFKAADAGDAVRRGFIRTGDEDVSKALREAGIPGIKYLDQGSRPPRSYADTVQSVKHYGDMLKKEPNNKFAAEQLKLYQDDLKKHETGSRNYVVFDDKLIDILKKYGIAGIGALPAMNAFHYQDKQ